jgi:hypothetical protein
MSFFNVLVPTKVVIFFDTQRKREDKIPSFTQKNNKEAGN